MLRCIAGASWLLVDTTGSVVYGAGELRDAVQLGDVVHPEDLGRVRDGVAAVLVDPAHTFVGHARVLHDGAWSPAGVTAVNRIDDPGIGGIVVRVLAEESASSPVTDDLIGSLAEAVPTPILVADQSGIVVFSNSAA